MDNIKKFFLVVTLVVAEGTFSGYTIYRNHQNKSGLSEIARTNIEALAEDETTDNIWTVERIVKDDIIKVNCYTPGNAVCPF